MSDVHAPDVPSPEVLGVSALKRAFVQGDETIHVLRGVDLSLRAGEIVALLGPSGAGKSTLLQAVGLLEGGFEGSIRILGKEVGTLESDARTIIRRNQIGFVYQFHHLLPDFTAAENVMLPLLIKGSSPADAHTRAADLLTTLGLGPVSYTHLTLPTIYSV